MKNKAMTFKEYIYIRLKKYQTDLTLDDLDIDDF